MRPWLVTRDEVNGDPQALRMLASGSTGETMQVGIDRDNGLRWWPISSAISAGFMPLTPARDPTGTPPGAAWDWKPPRYLRPGDLPWNSASGGLERRRRT